MEYFTTVEMSEKWNILPRRIGMLCAEGRIEGAVKKGKTWLIPTNMRQRFLKENHGGIYSYMILSETLWKHLAETDEEWNEMMDRLVVQMARKEGVTEQLKSNDWLCWLQKMYSIRSRAEEVVLHDLIYSL